jgi:hypothetical protein
LGEAALSDWACLFLLVSDVRAFSEWRNGAEADAGERQSQNCKRMWPPEITPNAEHGGKSRWFMLSARFPAHYSRGGGTRRVLPVRLARAIRDLKSRPRCNA